MADRRKLRVVRGGACPASLIPGLERAIEVQLRAMSTELGPILESAEVDLSDDELADCIREARGAVTRARLRLAQRKDEIG